MEREKKTPASFWLTIIAATFLFDAAVIRVSLLRWNELGMDLLHSAWGAVLLLYLVVLLVCVWLFIRISRHGELYPNAVSRLNLTVFESVGWRALGFVVFGAVVFLIPFVKFTLHVGGNVENPSVDPILLSYFYYWTCWWAVLLAMTALKVAIKTSWQLGFVVAGIILGVAYETWTRFGAVSTYPLSMGWSEGSRYYYASLYFSKWIYGESLPLSTLHPTRYLLQSIPFLVPSLGLAAHRFWQFFLWMGLTAWSSIAIANRVSSHEQKLAKWLIAGGLFLFLLRMGVYYHLEPMVILPLVFVSAKHPIRSLLAVIAASLWAGISRVNWFPMPAMIATAIYLLETPVSAKPSIPVWKRITSYLSMPVAWIVIAVCSAFAAQAAYIPLSGNGANAEAFASSLSSDLLWYRLLPNPNFQLGILPATLILSFPLIATIILATRQWESLHVIRWLGLFGMLIVLFAGSLVVSAKIGGGGDLHNMDTFAVMLAIVAAYFIGGQVVDETGVHPAPVRSWSLIILAVVIPLVFLIPSLAPRPTYDKLKNQDAYRALVQTVNYAGQYGPVLLINERQLAAFGDVDVPLVADYEAVTLMEMAMSGNRVYLNRFRTDLRSQRFSAIITNPQNLAIKSTGPLQEENNVWNTLIAPYILCYYMPSQRIETDWNRIEIYVPNPDVKNCP